MLSDHFPLLGLRITTPRLELRLPSAEQLGELADTAAAGVHDPERTPFSVPWTDGSPDERARSVVQHHWRVLSGVTASNWTLNLTVVLAGTVVGQQSIGAREFAVTREVRTGSWLGLRHHGQGIGTEMRAAVLHLAFAELGAEEAVSGAFDHNASSQAVSRKLGYRPDGIERQVSRGALAIQHRLRLTRADWEAHRSVPVTVTGLGPCLGQLGL